MTIRLPCLLCTETFLNASTVITHYARDHSPILDSSQAVYGNVCPKCGDSFDRLEQHSSRAHQRQVAVLFAEVRREGDPRGVVTARVNRMISDGLSDLERAFQAFMSPGD